MGRSATGGRSLSGGFAVSSRDAALIARRAILATWILAAGCATSDHRTSPSADANSETDATSPATVDAATSQEVMDGGVAAMDAGEVSWPEPKEQDANSDVQAPAFDAAVSTMDAASDSQLDPETAPTPECSWVDTGVAVIESHADIERLRGCSELTSSVVILGSSLEDLKGLEGLRVIRGFLLIAPNLDIAKMVGGDDLSHTGGEITADLSSAPTGALRSLAGLEGLQSVARLELIGLDVPNLHGLSSLQSAPEIHIRHMNKLQNLTGLEQLRALRSITLSQLPISNLGGLDNVETIQRITVSSCDELRDLSGAIKLTYIDTIWLKNNHALKAVSGLALSMAPDRIMITDSPILDDITALLPADASLVTVVDLRQLPALRDLSALSHLSRINYILSIQECDGLKDLSGLEQVTFMGGLWIERCANLQSLNGLGALEKVGDRFFLIDLQALVSLEGLERATSLRQIVIDNCGALTSLAGLDTLEDGMLELNRSSLKTLESLAPAKLSEVSIRDNPLLESLEGIVSEQLLDLTIAHNDSLQHMNGLETLASIGRLVIDNNAALVDLQGLEHLTTATKLQVTTNTSLANLQSLGALTSASELAFDGNGKLPQCEVAQLASRLSLPEPAGVNDPTGICTP